MKKNTRKNNYYPEMASASSSKEKEIVAITGIFLILVMACILVLIWSFAHYSKNVNQNANPEEILIEKAEDYDQRLDEVFIEKVTREEHEIDERGLIEHLVLHMKPYGNRLAMNTREFNQKLASGDSSEFGEFTLVELSKEQVEMIETAKEHVVAYINSSDILKDKEVLIEKIKNIEFYKYSDVEFDVDGKMLTSVATCVDGAIYINQKCEESFCAYVATHELIHCLSDFTNDGKSIYKATTLEEAMTDALTNAIDPCHATNANLHYGYSELFPMLYSYMNFLGEDAIEAFFYGYDKIFEKYGENFILEHDAFVSIMLCYEDDEMLASDLMYQMIEKWRRDYQEAG